MLAATINQAKDNGGFSDPFTHCKITLIHKRDDKEILSNYRSITLSNTASRIFERILTLRVKPLLQQMIHEHQRAYVPGRSIAEILLAVENAIRFCEEDDVEGFLLSLDLRKAFDNTRKEFIADALKAFGLPSEYIALVGLCFRRTVMAGVDGQATPPMLVENGLKQGSALSPVLFIIALEGLLLAIEDDPQVPPLTLRQCESKLRGYADDISLFLPQLQVIPAIVDTAMEFERAAGPGIGMTKSWILPMGKPSNLPHEAFGFTILAAGDERKLLGSTFGTDMTEATKKSWKHRAGAFCGVAQQWDPSAIHYAHRALAHTVFMMSKLVYAYSHQLPTDAESKAIKNTGLRFLWHGGPNLAIAKNIVGLSHGGIGWRNPSYVWSSLQARWIPIGMRNPRDLSSLGFVDAMTKAVANLLGSGDATIAFTSVNHTMFDLLPYLNRDDLKKVEEHCH
ncbi:MAG: RNA-directed DNA polymerase, partial [Myxococcota bacterium]